LRSLKRSKRSR